MDNLAKRNYKAEDYTGKNRCVLKILVADDNFIIRQILKEVFDSADFHPVMVDNGKKALEAVRKEPFDLVLMDLHMPEMDGFEATAHIRAMERETGHRLPILALTGYMLGNGREICMNAGMDDYLEKPFAVSELIKTVERLTRIKTGGSDHEAPLEE